MFSFFSSAPAPTTPTPPAASVEESSRSSRTVNKSLLETVLHSAAASVAAASDEDSDATISDDEETPEPVRRNRLPPAGETKKPSAPPEMSKIDRIKQKAMRSANRELLGMEDMGQNTNSSEIDVNFLASVLGMNPSAFHDCNASPVKSKSSKKKNARAMKEIPLNDISPDKIEDAKKNQRQNGMKGTSQTPLVGAQAGSLASALGISIDASEHAPAIREKRGSKSTQAVEHSVAPQAGSLAAALGMSVGPVDSVSQAKQQKVETSQPGSLAGALGMSTETENASQTDGKPQPGSLAFALGMQVSESAAAPAIQMHGHQKSRPKPQSHQAVVPPMAGSLAAALGVKVDVSMDAPPIRQIPEYGSARETQKNLSQAAPGSLAAALRMYVDTSPVSPAIREDGREAPPTQPHQGTTSLHQPQRGSLAAALGMSIDVSPQAAAVREYGRGPPVPAPESKASFAAPGSLAAALGMKVDRAYSAAPIREVGKAPPPVQPHRGTTFSGSAGQTSSAKAGSLAAALGMSVDYSTAAPPIREVGHRPPPVQSYAGTTFKGNKQQSLMDTVMSRVASSDSLSDYSDSSDEESQPDWISDARGGSLAAALGIKIDRSQNAAPIRERGQGHQAIHSRDASATATCILEDHFSKSQAKALVDAVNTLMNSGVKSESKLGAAVPRTNQMSAFKGKLNGYFSSDQVKSLVAAFGTLTGSDAPSGLTGNGAVATARSGSLAHALGMKVDAAPNAVPVRSTATMKTPSPPARKTLTDTVLGLVYSDESESDSESDSEWSDAGSSTESTGWEPQKGTLAAALGMKVDSSAQASAMRIKGRTPPPAMFKQANADETFSKANPGSLAAALGMKIDSSSRAAPIRENGQTPPLLRQHPKTEIHVASAQAGSLAEALGIKVDSSSNAVPIRANGYTPPSLLRSGASKSHGRKTLFDTVMNRIVDSDSESDSYDSDSDSDYSDDDFTVKHRNIIAAEPGSLAAALGMQIDCSGTAAPIREKGGLPPPLQPLESRNLVAAQHGSLAAALGLRIDSSNSAPPIREEGCFAPSFMHQGSTPRPVVARRSLFDLVMSNLGPVDDISDSSDEDSVVDDRAVNARVGSLADALGMKIDTTPEAAPIREMGRAPPVVSPLPPQRMSLADIVLARMSTTNLEEESVSSGSDSSDEESAGEVDVALAQVGSLAAALGMPVARSTMANPVDDASESDESSDSSDEESVGEVDVGLAQVGSLAAALGMPVTRSTMANPVDDASESGESSDSSDEESVGEVDIGLAQVGSLAAALGMPVASSKMVNPVGDASESDGSYSDSEYDSDSESSDDESVGKSNVKAAQPGSFVAALQARGESLPMERSGAKTHEIMDESEHTHGTLEDALGAPEQKELVSSAIKQKRSMSKSKKSLFDAAILRMGLPELEDQPKPQEPKSQKPEKVPVVPKKGKTQYKSRLERMQAKAHRAATREGDTSFELKNPAAKRAEILKSSPATITHDNSVPADAVEDIVNSEEFKSRMSRIERMKAKAIKAANKDLGMDPSELADALGMPLAAGSSDDNQGEGGAQHLDVNEDDIAVALGIPKSLFGVAPQPSRSLPASEPENSKPEPETEALTATNKKSEGAKPVYKSRLERMQAKLSRESKRKLMEGTEAETAVVPGESSALSAVAQPSPAEKEALIETRQMSRLDRMKAKAIKAANKDLGVDAGELADALGIASKSTSKATSKPPNAVKRNNSRDSVSEVSKDKSSDDDTEYSLGLDIDDVAAALGMPAHLFGMPKKKSSTKAEPPQPEKPPLDEFLYDRDEPEEEGEMMSIAAVIQMRSRSSQNNLMSMQGEGDAATPGPNTEQAPRALASDIQTPSSPARAPIGGVHLAAMGKHEPRSPGGFQNEVMYQSPNYMREASLRAALVESQAQAAGVDAYNKRLEEQLFQRAKIFSDKLAMLEGKISVYEVQIGQKSEQIKELEANIAAEKKEKQSLSMQWTETGTKLEQAVEKVHQSRALLQQEYTEVQAMKNALQEQHSIISKRIDDLHALESRRSSVMERMGSIALQSESSPEKTSSVLRNIQLSLRAEGERRKSLTARLKARGDKEAAETTKPAFSLVDAVMTNIKSGQPLANPEGSGSSARVRATAQSNDRSSPRKLSDAVMTNLTQGKSSAPKDPITASRTLAEALGLLVASPAAPAGGETGEGFRSTDTTLADTSSDSLDTGIRLQ